MPSRRDLLERQLADIELRPFTLDQFHHRRRRKQRIRRIGTAAIGLALAAGVAGGVLTAIDTDPDERTYVTDVPDPGTPDPVDVPEAVDRMVEALNTRDVDAFIEAFYVAADDPQAVGGFAPRGGFADSSSIYPSWEFQPITDAELVRAWMQGIDAWGLEAEVTACTRRTETIEFSDFMADAVVECEVVTRWHALSMEIIEGWFFELRGSEVLWWDSLSCCRRVLDLVDLDPPDRTLPLGFEGLQAWEAWLQTNHPDDAARLLYEPGEPSESCLECDELAPGDLHRAIQLAAAVERRGDGWTIDRHRFTPIGLIPYDPAFADEISTSIE